MMRPLMIATCLMLGTAASAACAQDAAPVTPPPGDTSATAAPATDVPATAPADASAPVGDPARGHRLTYTCQGCHGVPGYQNAYPNFHVPKIGGQSEQYLINALTAYKEGTRSHPTMEAQADGFSAQDIADIAAFLSSLSK